MKRLLLSLLAYAAVACSGDVDVHGVPSKIELATPFCVPSPSSSAAKDAGAPVDAGVDADSLDAEVE